MVSHPPAYTWLSVSHVLILAFSSVCRACFGRARKLLPLPLRPSNTSQKRKRCDLHIGEDTCALEQHKRTRAERARVKNIRLHRIPMKKSPAVSNIRMKRKRFIHHRRSSESRKAMPSISITHKDQSPGNSRGRAKSSESSTLSCPKEANDVQDTTFLASLRKSINAWKAALTQATSGPDPVDLTGSDSVSNQAGPMSSAYSNWDLPNKAAISVPFSPTRTRQPSEARTLISEPVWIRPSDIESLYSTGTAPSRLENDRLSGLRRDGRWAGSQSYRKEREGSLPSCIRCRLLNTTVRLMDANRYNASLTYPSQVWQSSALYGLQY